MKIRALMDFYDREAGLVLRETDDEFMVSEARGMELIEKRFAEEILEPKSQKRR
ncbi:hypothetical protein HW273_05560 [Oribacterium sp. oral taxon 102]|uniref:hypothetical protein n=1 Tax=Oribacterium sp. oral taxon 102 TaxID=671214 RepID=UPI0015BEBA0E|nr:hypothetical protein [Oribacterium sp. oral taxon 102]NWO21361.1 hypothetical protein [Oribacterium sp. oral taxon 102]